MGFDDNRDLDIEGARSAAPIWMQFMKDALKYREYRDTKPFAAPDGIVTIDIDPETGYPATPTSRTRATEVYIAGTQPVGGGGQTVATTASGWDTPAQQEEPAAQRPPTTPGDHLPHITGSGSDGQVSAGAVARRAANQIPPDPSQKQQPDAQAKKDSKPSLLRRLLNVIK